MANSRLAQILEQEYKTKGIAGGAVSAFGKRTKEKMDIRNSLFSGGGLGSIIGTKMFGKGYSATKKTNSFSTTPASPSLDVSSNPTLEDINTNSKITAKNTLAIPMMARDMNLVKLNISRMVKLLGGQANVNKTDMFFSNAKKREEEYERQFGQFGKKPEQLKSDGTKKDESGGFLSTILGFFKGGIGNIIETLISALIKGGLVAGVLVGIGKYFNDPEFREKVNGMALKLFETIDSVLKTIFGEDYKKELAIGAAVVAGVVVTFGAALVGLQAAIIAATAAIGKAILGGGGVPGSGLPDNIPDNDKNKKNGKTGRKLPQRDPKTGRFMKAAPPSGGKFGGRAAGILGGLMVLEAATGGALSSIINYDDDRVWAISSDFEKTPYFDNITDDEMSNFIEFLENKKYDEASNYYKSLGPKYGYTQKNKGGVSGFFGATEWIKSPTPVAVPTSTSSVGPSPTTTTDTNNAQSNSGGGSETTPTKNNNDNSRIQIEGYLGKAISDREYDALLKAVGAEAGSNPMERAAVAAVILNRAKKLGGTGADIIRALNAPLQFQAITGPDGKSGTTDNPHSANAKKVIPGIDKQIAENLALIPKGLDSFTSAVPGAYKDVGGQAKYEQKMTEMKNLGGQQIGQSVFSGGGVSVAQAGGGGGSARTQVASAQNSVLAAAAAASDKPLFSSDDLAAFAAALRAPAMQNGGGGLTQVASVSKATPYERDFYQGVVRTVAL